MMFWTGLIFRQSSEILVKADQRYLESLAPLNWISHTGTTNEETSSLNTREVFQFLQLSHELLFVFLGYFCAEFEEY